MPNPDKEKQILRQPLKDQKDSRIPDFFFILGIIVLSFLACLSLLNGKFFHTHETLSPLTRLASLYKYFGDGQILTRWIPDLSRGYGLPLFNFYPPLFYYIALAFAFAGIGLVSALNYACILLWICSGLSMYLFTREFFGKYGAFIAAIAYVYAPYHILDLYVRGAVAEFTAFPLFPLILWSFYKQSQSRNILYIVTGAISYGLLLITHNIMALIFTPVVLAYIAFLYVTNTKDRITALFYNLSGFVLGMMLSAFFWLPAIIEKKFAQVSGLLTGYLNYHNHFVYLDQLIYSPWGYGRSEPGRADNMSFQVGMVHLILSIASVFIIKKILKKSKTSGAHALFFLSITPVIVFFISSYSLFLWEHLPLLKFVQFSWRFLSLIILIVSFLSGSLFFVIKNRKVKKIMFLIVTALLILTNLSYCKSKWYFNTINDELTLPSTYINNPKISAFAYYLTDFTPIWVKEVPRYPAPQQLAVLQGDASVTSLEQRATVHRFLVQGETDAKLRFHMFYFPGWQVSVDGVNTAIDLTNESGLFDFQVPKGTHQIKIKLSHTPLRSTAIFISLFSLMILAILLMMGLVNHWENTRGAGIIRGPPEKIAPELKQPLEPKRFLLPVCLFIGSFVVYLKTLCPSVYGGDSGEILSAIATLGIAHPTGFPLYMLTGKLFSLIIPFGDIAFRVNILSAFFAALTVVIIYAILRALVGKKSVCLAGALCFAFSATLWSHATVARVYIMTCFFVALSVYIIILWNIERKDKYFYFFAVTLGLGLGTHATMLLTIPMALAMVMMTDIKALIRPAALKAAGLAVILTIMIYLYIPLATLRDPLVNWGNPVNLDSFIYYITQKEYSFKIAASTLSSAFQVFFLSMKLFILDFTPLGFLTILLGFFTSWKKHKKILISFSIVVIGNILLMINYGGTEQDIPILFRYLFPSYMVMSVWAGLGLHYIYIYLKTRLRHPLVPVLALIILPLACFVTHYHQNDRSQNYIVLDYANNVLNTIPPGSLLFTVGDAISGPIQYIQTANGVRDDLAVFDRELLSRDWYCRHILKHFPDIIPEDIVTTPAEKRLFHIIDTNISRKPVFATFAMLKQYENIPYGLVYKIFPKDTLPDFDQIKETNDTLWEHYTQRGLLDSRIYKDYMLKEIVEGYGKAKNNLALYYSSNKHVEDAMKEYQIALEYNPENFASLFNLGQLYKQNNRPQEGAALLKKAMQINPDFLLQSSPIGGAAPKSDFALMPSESGNEQDAVQRHLQTGIQFGTIGNHQKAVEEFKKALELKPDDSSIYVLLGTAYMNSYASDAAIDMYKKAIELNPGAESAIAYLNLGAIYANAKKDYPKTLIYLEKYVDLVPNSPDAIRIRSQIQQIRSMLQHPAQEF